MTYEADRAKWERQYWRALIARHPGNIAQAAREAGINRTSLYRIIKRYRLVRYKRVRTSWGNDAWQSLR